jgi:hypothetical protein
MIVHGCRLQYAIGGVRGIRMVPGEMGASGAWDGASSGDNATRMPCLGTAKVLEQTLSCLISILCLVLGS